MILCTPRQPSLRPTKVSGGSLRPRPDSLYMCWICDQIAPTCPSLGGEAFGWACVECHVGLRDHEFEDFCHTLDLSAFLPKENE
eukprot:1023160-Prymnesium_polylepis.2